jgi:A1 cistron-splicing factor AAR2
MASPPRTTLIFDNFPTDWTVGVDLHFFNTNNLLKGIKLIPQGIHVVHWAQDPNSIRSGYFFEAHEGDVIVLYWDSQNETMHVGDEVGELNIRKQMDNVSGFYPYMIAYPGDVTKWRDLTRYVKWSQVEYILPKCHIDSVMTSSDENNLLLKTLQQHSKDRNIANDPIVNSIIDQSDIELKFTIIDLEKRVRPNSSPEEKTKDALDKSWFLKQLLISGYNNSDDTLLGEFELSFINMVIFANYSSSTQWLKILRISLNCKDLVARRSQLFLKLMNQFYLMLTHLPEEYMDEFIDESFLETYVGEFDYTVKELGLHSLVKVVIDIKALLLSKFGINVDGLINDEDDDPVVVDI